jgi:serine/threonine protein phosphatase PrpC
MISPEKPDFHGLTDRGRVRPVNEDQFLNAELSRLMVVHQTSLDIQAPTQIRDSHSSYLFIVADGLGGAPQGARASSLAVDSVIRSVLGAMPWFLRQEEHAADLAKELSKVFEKCELTIQADVEENPSLRGMGTTLTMAYLVWPWLYVVHVGDARAYLLRGSDLHQITRDHTLSLPPSAPEARTALLRKPLWNVIGGENSEVWPEVHKVDLQERDILLLSTDGLTRFVPPDRLHSLLSNSPSSRAACESLVAAANEAGGTDNVTAVVVRFGPRDSDRLPQDLVAASAIPEPDDIGAPEGEDLEEV